MPFSGWYHLVIFFPYGLWRDFAFSSTHNHFSFRVCEWWSPHSTVSKRLLHSYQKAICSCETVKSKLSIIMKWLSMPSDLRERRCCMNTQTIWEIACQLIRMQTLHHAGTMKPVSQLKGAIQEAGKNSISARRWHSMKYMNVHK